MPTLINISVIKGQPGVRAETRSPCGDFRDTSVYISQLFLRMDVCPPNKSDNNSAKQFVFFFFNTLSRHLAMSCLILRSLQLNGHFLRGMAALFLGSAWLAQWLRVGASIDY